MSRYRKKHRWFGKRFTAPQAMRIRRAVMDKNTPRDRSPFSLGIDGEYWEEQIPALIIPIPGGDLSLMCIRTYDGSYELHAMQDAFVLSDLLMVASVAHEWVKKYESQKVGQRKA